ncbi:uncharacterized protein LOC133364423 isoform X3 [Rhineura floridana]|uniref:uncharacterized protein LOC133364423 isoform X3 n=1 Tax=Rhineura floridana TaxID=261503 RepID=UPI002AC8365D|nr:uncharacterized protein LOC133364423 isoform X3 [Rhineura floridana]
MTLRGLRWRQQGGGGGSSSSPSAAPACPLCCRRRRPPCTMIPPPPPPVHDDPLLLRRRRHLPERHQPAAVKMSGSGNYQEFQTVEMRKELEESNKENSDAGSASGPNSTTAPPSASKTMLYPRPYADPYDSRKYFATRTALGVFPADSTGAPVEALVELWNTEMARGIDTIAPARPLRCRAHTAPWYIPELRVMKQERRRLECRWRRTPDGCNYALL